MLLDVLSNINIHEDNKSKPIDSSTFPIDFIFYNHFIIIEFCLLFILFNSLIVVGYYYFTLHRIDSKNLKWSLAGQDSSNKNNLYHLTNENDDHVVHTDHYHPRSDTNIMSNDSLNNNVMSNDSMNNNDSCSSSCNGTDGNVDKNINADSNKTELFNLEHNQYMIFNAYKSLSVSHNSSIPAFFLALIATVFFYLSHYLLIIYLFTSI